jgi:hypothetical protein
LPWLLELCVSSQLDWPLQWCAMMAAWSQSY